jgi:hypothetical protein
MRKVIVINGKPRAGKDTAVMFMKAHLTHWGIPSCAFSSIDPVKDLLNPIVDLSLKTEGDRLLLASVGDALQTHCQFRTKRAMYEINDFFRTTERGVFFLHMREPALIAKMKCDCAEEGLELISVLLRSDDADDVRSNAADAGVYDGDYDREFSNNGSLNTLSQSCHALIKDILCI